MGSLPMHTWRYVVPSKTEVGPDLVDNLTFTLAYRGPEWEVLRHIITSKYNYMSTVSEAPKQISLSAVAYEKLCAEVAYYANAPTPLFLDDIEGMHIVLNDVGVGATEYKVSSGKASLDFLALKLRGG